MKLTCIAVLGLLTSSLAFGAQNIINEAWRGLSNPAIMASGFINDLSVLPLSGSIKVGSKGWSGHYWPAQKAGITNRWNSPKDETFDYKSPTREAVARMSLEQLAILSPAEKMDLYNGNYDFPFKKKAAKHSGRFAADWAGICHGWAPASIHHNEPTPKVVVNSDGLSVPFGSADIKALLSYHYAFEDNTPSRQMGLRCYFGSWMGGVRGCNEDLNAGAFHIVITNKLGLRGEGLMMDRERYREVWNQPVVGHNSKILQHYNTTASSAARSAVREVLVATELFYIDESRPTWNVGHGTENQIVKKMDLQYRLEIDAKGKIVGGEWESADRPDFLWYRPATSGFSGHLSNLKFLLDD